MAKPLRRHRWLEPVACPRSRQLRNPGIKRLARHSPLWDEFSSSSVGHRVRFGTRRPRVRISPARPSWLAPSTNEPGD